jgi:hypothetical protein
MFRRAFQGVVGKIVWSNCVVRGESFQDHAVSSFELRRV